MSIDVARARQLVPAAANLTYLGTNGGAPLPVPVTEAVKSALDGLQGGGVATMMLAGPQVERDTRAKLAHFLGCDPDEVAFSRNTGEGIVWTADSIRWNPGDQVLAYQGEYPTVVYPFLARREDGVDVIVRPRENGRITPAMVTRDLTPRTRLLAISFVQFDNGFRADLAAIAAACHANGTLLLVDAIQGLGALPLDVRAMNIDFLAAGTHKWLLALPGLGVYYVRRDLLPELRPVHVALGSTVEVPEEWPNQEYTLDLKQDASRFEEGTRNHLGLVALGASLDVILGFGIDDIAARIKELTDLLVAGAERRGCRVMSPRGEDEWSGILLWQPPAHRPAKQIVPQMHQQWMVVGEREECVWCGLNFYNSEEDVEKVLSFVD